MEAISLNYARRVADLVACSEKDGIARRFASCFAGRGDGRPLIGRGFLYGVRFGVSRDDARP